MMASMQTSMKTKSGVRNTCACELHDLSWSVKIHRYIDILKGTVFRKLQDLHFQSHMQIAQLS